MNLSIEDGYFKVSLSERNLRGLLRQFEESGSAFVGRTTQHGVLHVIVETDETHYHSPAREEKVRGVAGWSHPLEPTETVIPSKIEDTVKIEGPA